VRRFLPALALLFVGVASASAADLYRVAGTVTNTQTGAALRNAEVYVYGEGSSSKPVGKLMSNDGRFSFDLPQGSYALRAGTRTNAQIYGSRNPDIPLGSAVIVGPGHDTAHLTFRWYPPSAIFGKVVDASGEPVENALVQLVRSSVSAGRRISVTVRLIRTNDLGEYRFGYIPGGARYYVAVTGKPWYALDSPFSSNEGHWEAFSPIYYPNTTDVSRAAPLTLKAGEEVRADFTLTATVGANVTVKYDAPKGTLGQINLVSEGVAGTEGFQEAVALREVPAGVDAPERFTGVPPGRYVVQIAGKNGTIDLGARKRIDVNGSDVTVELSLHPFATVSGAVRFKNPGARPPSSMLETLVREGNTGTVGAAVHPDGSFVFPSVPMGTYRPAIRAAAGIFTEKIEGTGVRIHDGLLDLSEGDSATLSISASDESGSLSGFVMSGDQPLEAVLMVLAPAADSARPDAYFGYQTESDGSFDLKYVPAGHYLMFAVDDTAFEYANADAVRPYLASAKPVTIEAHGKSTERISLTPAIVQ
jgi:hypothetical protein